jgi:hypothetical protein
MVVIKAVYELFGPVACFAEKVTVEPKRRALIHGLESASLRQQFLVSHSPLF